MSVGRRTPARRIANPRKRHWPHKAKSPLWTFFEYGTQEPARVWLTRLLYPRRMPSLAMKSPLAREMAPSVANDTSGAKNCPWRASSSCCTAQHRKHSIDGLNQHGVSCRIPVAPTFEPEHWVRIWIPSACSYRHRCYSSCPAVCHISLLQGASCQMQEWQMVPFSKFSHQAGRHPL